MQYTVLVGTLQVKVIARTASDAVETAKEMLGNYPARIVDMKRIKK